MDLYLLSISLPSLVTALICTAAGYQLVPTLQKAKTLSGTSAPALRALIRGAGLACTFLAVACSLGAPQLIYALNPGLPPEQIALAGDLARITWFGLPCGVLGAIYTAECHVQQRFISATLLTQTPALGTIIFCLLFHNCLGVLAIVWGQMAGYLFMLVGFRLILGSSKAESNWREFRLILTGLPISILALLVFVIYPFSDAVWGSRTGASGVSYLGYCQRLLVGISGMLVVGATTVLFPKLAQQAAQSDHEALRGNLAFSLRAMLACMTPLAAILSVLALPTLQLLFQRGAFGLADAQAMAGLLPIMLLGMLAMSCAGLMFKALFAQDDKYAAAGLSLIGGGLYFLLSGWLSAQFGLVGIATAYAICWWFIFFASAARIWRGAKWNIILRKNLKFSARLAINASLVLIIASIGAFWLPNATAPNNWPRFVATTGIGISCLVVYFLAGNSLFVLEELRVLSQRGWSILRQA